MGPKAGWTGVWLLLLLGTANDAVADVRTFTRVRGADEEFRSLIREGDARSPTFRAMVDELQRTNAIVMVQFGFCAKGQVRSCVSNVSGDARQRHVRILVSTRTTSDRLIATIGHELHHALEILRDAAIVDDVGVMRLYRRIGNGLCAKGRSGWCETDAALAIEKSVLNELER